MKTLSCCIVVAAALASSAHAETCMQSALSTDAVDIALRLYKSDPNAAIDELTKMAMKSGHIKYAAGREGDVAKRVQNFVEWSLETATDSNSFNKKLAAQVEMSCEA